MNFLVDSDFLFGLYVPTDAHHERARRILRILKDENIFSVINLVIFETATLVSHRIGQLESIDFLKNFEEIPVKRIDLDKILEERAWEIFKKQTKKGTSFVDCANLATIDYFKLDGILSFDAFYPKKFRPQ